MITTSEELTRLPPPHARRATNADTIYLGYNVWEADERVNHAHQRDRTMSQAGAENRRVRKRSK